MSCLSSAEIAAAAADEAPRATEHAAQCTRCMQLLDEARTTRAMLERTPVLALQRDRRAALRAEVLAARDAAPSRRRRKPWVPVGTVAALAVVAAIALVTRRHSSEVAVLPRHVADSPAGEGAVPALAPGRPAPSVHSTRVAVDGARGRLGVTGSTLLAVVIAGSVEVERGVRAQVIERGELWAPPAKAPGRSKATRATRSPAVEAFHRGWRAFESGSYADAIAAFDVATDPVVAEDASYWAAIAAARSGDLGDARRRLRVFVATFPMSPHADSARAELARPGPAD